jgi:hypothetical protein
MWSPGSLGYAGTGGARGAKDSELWEMLDVELFNVFASEKARNAGIIEKMIRGSWTRDVLQTSLSIYQFESALWWICHPCLHIVSASPDTIVEGNWCRTMCKTLV